MASIEDAVQALVNDQAALRMEFTAMRRRFDAIEEVAVRGAEGAFSSVADVLDAMAANLRASASGPFETEGGG